MPKVAIILADGFEEVEAVAPIDVLRRAGVEVLIVGLS
ncbi:MAG: DJ-1/PfpI family protein, partial [Hydrogenobacter thermophilus]|nr:DJ-1/PfpI family protein [Hydrogenobacter thermophilus]